MDVPFVDLNKLTYDLVVSMGGREVKKPFLCGYLREYMISAQKEKIDNTHLNISGGKVVAGIAMEAVAQRLYQHWHRMYSSHDSKYMWQIIRTIRMCYQLYFR